jgi:hypothetical protein
VPRIANPYRPGFNRAPATLAGRQEVLEDLVDALETAALDRRTPRPVMLVGSRGMGKTVLLAEAGARAGAEFGWPRVHVELRPGSSLIGDLSERLDAARQLVEQAPDQRGLRAQSATVRAQLAGIGGEVRFERALDEQPAASLRTAMLALVSTLVERDSGFVLTLDEAHLARRDELAELAALLQEGTGEDWPLVVVAAGLPSMRAPEHSVTYFERAAWHELQLLTVSDAALALLGPAEQSGRPMDDDAAQLLAEASGGYPYAIQLYGHHAWRASSNQARIDKAAAERAVPRAERELERGLYASRWTAAPAAQKQYLAAVADLITSGEAATGRTVADRLGRTTRQLSRVRDQLLTQGTLTVVGDAIRFTVPGMAEYVVRHHRLPSQQRSGVVR